MKRVLMSAVLLVGGTGMVVGQEFVAPQEFQQVPVTPESERLPVAPDPTVEGIVAKIFNVDRPWQLVNPAAPESYGDGRSNGTVSRDPNAPGKPKGFILFALDW